MKYLILLIAVPVFLTADVSAQAQFPYPGTRLYQQRQIPQYQRQNQQQFNQQSVQIYNFPEQKEKPTRPVYYFEDLSKYQQLGRYFYNEPRPKPSIQHYNFDGYDLQIIPRR